MMYPFLQIDGDTEIVHSEMQPNGQVKVYIEKPDAKDGFHHATCFLPGYQWEDISGFSQKEIARFQEVLESTAHLILEFSQQGGFEHASGLKDRTILGVFLGQRKYAAGAGTRPCGRGSSHGKRDKDLDHQGRKVPALQQRLQDPGACSAKHHAHHRSPEVVEKWTAFFGEASYYC